MSADGDRVRRLLDNKPYGVGVHQVLWDGKDDTGETVPDEAYTPFFEVTNDDVVYRDAPMQYSGGEVIPNIEWQRSSDTDLSYSLPDAARVLVRLGVTDGPMMRELKHWQPTSPGRVVERWNGFDADEVEYFADRTDVWVVVMAYQLPQYSIITTGNNSIDYRDYRTRRGWSRVEAALAEIKLQRDGVRLERNYFVPRGYLPRVSLQFENTPEMSRVGIAQVQGTVRFRVDVPAEDRWILDSSFYETGLYIDYQFQSEEEQGFVPMVWEYDSSDLEPGRHIATVQLFGFGGFITSSTVEFIVVP